MVEVLDYTLILILEKVISTMSSKLYQPKRISGFPEWLPEVRMIELAWMDKLRQIFESYGFCSVETSSVEELKVIEAKGGDVDKEIYVINRLGANPSEGLSSRLALHYDLTVPLARYVAQNFNELVFPFKRYQIQRVWRGERPQEGRFREFYQADIDIINIDNLPLYFDAEMLVIIYEALRELNVGQFRILINNRKLIQGVLAEIGITDTIPIVRALDKIDKIGKEKVLLELNNLGLSSRQSSVCMQLVDMKYTNCSFAEKVKSLAPSSKVVDEGIEELTIVMNALQSLPEGSVIIDLSIARGFDYYTGTVYEVKLEEFPGFGSICSGGRYDDLASSFIDRKLPGVGISIGLTRLFSKLLSEGRFEAKAKSPAQVLVTWMEPDQFEMAKGVAQILRKRMIKTELYYTNDKIQKQLRYASRKGISYVWFLPYGDISDHQVKNMLNGQQIAVDPYTWTPEG
jgi:histidyl-tRNA synthetase